MTENMRKYRLYQKDSSMQLHSWQLCMNRFYRFY